MKKNRIILIIICLLFIVLVGISFFFWNNKTLSIVTLDINPSIEIQLMKENTVKKVIALNEDGKKIISNNLKGKKLEESLKIIVDNIIEKGYAEDEHLIVLLYSNGNIDNGKIISLLADQFAQKGADAEMISVDKITKEDKKMAEKYGISPAKAVYINELTKKNKNLSAAELINKQVKELIEMKNTSNYCEEGYTLEGDLCYKEIERVAASIGDVCPRYYFEYNGTCYEEVGSIDGPNDTCLDNFTMENGVCTLTDSHRAQGHCESGEYNDRDDVCIEKEYTGDAYEYCRDPGRTLYDHKCLATKPSINGGCLGNDMYYNGKCVNTIDDYYLAEWMCPDGQNISRPNGELLYEDKKCYNEKRTAPISYTCEDGFTVNGNTCIKVETHPIEKEKICPTGYTLIQMDRCINLNKTKEFESGHVCKEENSKVKGNQCIIYEIIPANHVE